MNETVTIPDTNDEEVTVRTFREYVVLQTGDQNGRPAYLEVEQATQLIAALQAAILVAAEYNG